MKRNKKSWLRDIAANLWPAVVILAFASVYPPAAGRRVIFFSWLDRVCPCPLLHRLRRRRRRPRPSRSGVGLSSRLDLMWSRFGLNWLQLVSARFGAQKRPGRLIVV